MGRRSSTLPNRQQDRALVEAAEREKLGLAKQLHEGLLQTLSAAAILARVVSLRAKSEPALPMLEFQRLQDTIDAAIDEARQLIRQLQPPGIERKGLVTALEDLVEAVGSKCKVEFTQNDGVFGPLDSRAAVALFRIAQESVKCALQRRNVSKIIIALTFTPKSLRLEIRDNGRWESRAGRSENFDTGLLMASHASLIRGELKMEHDRRGTLVTCIYRSG